MTAQWSEIQQQLWQNWFDLVKSIDPEKFAEAFDEDLLVVWFDDDPEEWEYFSITHNEPNLTISGGNGSAEYDIDGDGIEEPADVDFDFERI